MTTKKAKPRKDPQFPLWWHKGAGQWCKKVNQHFHYFGDDKVTAAKRWHDEKDAIYAGLTPKTRSDGPTISELANVYLADRKEQHRLLGKPGARHISLCEGTIRRLIGLVGAGCSPADLGPSDFGKVRRKLFEPIKREKAANGGVFGRQVEQRSPETVAGDVRRIKGFLNWCHSMEYIPAPRYGKEFPIEVDVAHTKESIKQRKARRDFSADEITRMIELASPQFKPLLMLAINAGVGNSDIAAIEWDDIEGLGRPDPWIDLPRLKTGAPRRFPVWPETAAAIRDYLPVRERYAGRKYVAHVFLTSRGLPWVRGNSKGDHVDTIGTTFAKLRASAGLARGSFYDFRRTFATVACETLDTEAVRFVMGHTKDRRDMTARYAQAIDDARLKAVTEHVRNWLLKEGK